MCGIGGWLGSVRGDEDLAQRMTTALHHRGPDDQATMSFDGATLVHTRLKVIDVTNAGRQPMLSSDGSVAVVFNGEIYNFRELRRQLEVKGHRFRSTCDAEVLPALFQEHGIRFVERLRGMFAIAVLHVPSKTLHLFRDRFGIKPLFYAIVDGAVAFASELPSLLEVPGAGGNLNAQALRDYAALFYIPAPSTIYQNCFALPPGHAATITMQRGQPSVKKRAYHEWHLGDAPTTDVARAAALAEQLLDEAVASQLEADVPLGALLSGGIDSSLVVEAARRHRPLRTFNVRFREAAYDETWAAREVAQHTSTVHETLDFESERGSWDSVVGIFESVGQPYADTSLFAAHGLARLIRRHVTVALSGDGGDEAFGGYAGYRRARWLSQLLRLPGEIPRTAFGAAATTFRALSPAVPSLAVLHHRTEELARERDSVGIVAAMQTWIRPDEHERLCSSIPGDPVRRLFEPTWDIAPTRQRSAFDRLASVLTESYVRLRLANDYLFKIDRASMAHGLEVRVPMLDEALFQLGLDLPVSTHVGVRGSKRVLRRVAEQRLPPAIAKKPKGGFGVPVDRWLDTEFRAELKDALLGPASEVSSWFDPAVYGPVVTSFCGMQPQSGVSRGSHYERVMMLLSLHVTLQQGRQRRERQPA